MPNWVYNYLDVDGKPEDVAKFIEKARQPYKITEEWEYDEGVFFFWNFKKPTDLKAYVAGGEDGKLALENRRLFAGDNWYDWNVRNWGTKWEACYAEVTNSELDKGLISYKFDTAWSMPEELFTEMVAQHPELTFDIHCEEETGWGAEYEGKNGVLTQTKSWDEPNSHADYVDRMNEDGCICAWEDDQDEWYADCPKDEAEPDPKAELAEKLRQQIIEKTGVSKEWADSHLEVIL